MLEMHWRERIADQLARLGSEIERLGALLCEDEELMTRNLTALQAVDAIAQQQHCLATLLRADDLDAAIDTLSFAALRERLIAARP